MTEDSRPYHVLDDPVVYPVILLGVLLTTAFPIFLRQHLCLPLLNGLVIFPFFAWAVRVGRPRRAIGLGLYWAVCQSAATVVASLLMAEQATAAIWLGLETRSEALAWIASGQGIAGAPLRYLPVTLRNFTLFVGSTAATAGAGGLVLLATSLNRVNFTVASLWQQAANPWLLALAAWPPWLPVRLLGYLACGAVLAEPVAVLDLRPAWWVDWWQRRRRLLVAGLAILLLSLALQALLAPVWDDLLRLATGVG